MYAIFNKRIITHEHSIPNNAIRGEVDIIETYQTNFSTPSNGFCYPCVSDQRFRRPPKRFRHYQRRKAEFFRAFHRREIPMSTVEMQISKNAIDILSLDEAPTN